MSVDNVTKGVRWELDNPASEPTGRIGVLDDAPSSFSDLLSFFGQPITGPTFGGDSASSIQYTFLSGHPMISSDDLPLSKLDFYTVGGLLFDLGSSELVNMSHVPAQDPATTRTFHFRGTISEITDDANNLMSSNFSVGQTVSGSFTVDSAASDTLPEDPEFGRYPGVIFQVDVEGSSFSGVAQHRIRNDSNSRDSYTIVEESAAIAGGFSGPTFGNLVPDGFHISLTDTTATVFSDDSAFGTLPSLTDFDQQSNFLRFASPDDPFGDFGLIKFTIVSIVPEPGGVALVLLGTMLLYITSPLRGRHARP